MRIVEKLEKVLEYGVVVIVIKINLIGKIFVLKLYGIFLLFICGIRDNLEGVGVCWGYLIELLC